jgi:thiamine-phosphate pyrophosphorylase
MRQSRMERAKLARAASALNARSLSLPALILMTDEKRLPDPVTAACDLPRGSAVILRHTNAELRHALAEELLAIARPRKLRLLIAGDAALATRIGADGLHLPETRLREAAHWKTLHPSWLITVAAHSASALARAATSRADAALLAPAFPTKSHSERPSIGVARFRLMAARARMPVYALGGVNARTAGRLAGANLAGIAAIEGLVDQS